MNDEQKAKPADAQELTHEEVCEDALKHYEKLASECCDWYNVVPEAIEFYRKNGGPPQVGIDEKAEYLLKARIRQFEASINSGKMQIAIETLCLLKNSKRLTLQVVAEIAAKALSDMASIGNPEVEEECPK